MLGTSHAIKEQRERLKAEKKVKTYSIKELMECESSDDEGYEFNAKRSADKFFPWFKKDYVHISDQLDYTEQERVTTIKEEQYPTSEKTD